MIIRVVRMHFKENDVEAFLEIFQGNKEAIRNMEGCIHLQLLKDVTDPLTYTTISHWKSAEDLENYRKSELFESVWGRVKTFFSARTEAFSLEKVLEL